MGVIIQPPTYVLGGQKNFTLFKDVAVQHDTVTVVSANPGTVTWVSAQFSDTAEAGWLLFYDAVGATVTSPEFAIAVGTVNAGPVNMAITLVFKTAIEITFSGSPLGNVDPDGGNLIDGEVVLLHTT